MPFALRLKSCPPSVIRSWIRHMKPNIRNMSSVAGGEWCLAFKNEREFHSLGHEILEVPAV